MPAADIMKANSLTANSMDTVPSNGVQVNALLEIGQTAYNMDPEHTITPTEPLSQDIGTTVIIQANI